MLNQYTRKACSETSKLAVKRGPRESVITRPRLIYITTVALSVGFFRGQLTYMRDRGFDIVVISAPGDELRRIRDREGVTTVAIPMEREISPLKDLIALVRLYRVLRQLRPAIVNVGTPKAGLLGMISAYAANVPVRVYSLHGLRLETAHGIKRYILGASERCASAFAHRVICVSKSLQRLYVKLGFTTEAKACVLGEGSVNGLDADKFRPTPQGDERARALRARLAIPDGAPVIGFVGRLTRDKGVPELLDAFDQVLRSFPDARLLMLGDFENGDPIPDSYVKRLQGHPRVVMAGFVSDTSPYYAIMHVLAFPSYREGYPTAPLEAAAAEVPTVAFKATGSVDAVCDGITGALVPLGDVASFARTLERYLSDDALRRVHGQSGHERVVRLFRPEMIWESLYEEYARLLKTKDLTSFQKLGCYSDTATQSARQN
jgi:glycosyltransferase involved in cell wall biosynthesis